MKKRRSIRLKNYDYSQQGVYFVTICVHGGVNLFWKQDVEDGEYMVEKGENMVKKGENMVKKGENMVKKGENMVSPVRLNDVGFMMDKWWRKMSEKYNDEIEMDEYVIMPNHIHGIIKIVGANPCIRPINNSRIENKYAGIGRYVSWFKRMSVNEYIRNVKNNNWISFEKKFWHRNYYEHIIRDEEDLNRIRQYIIDNPLKWEGDKYYNA